MKAGVAQGVAQSFRTSPSPNAWSRGCAQAEGGSGCWAQATGGVRPQRSAAADRGRPGALGLAFCTFEAVLTGGIDAKVSMKAAGRPRRVLEWLAECEGCSVPENNGEERGKGGRGTRRRRYQILPTGHGRAHCEHPSPRRSGFQTTNLSPSV